MFHGSIVALITPFSDNKVDVPALSRLIRFQLDNGTHAIVALGTTGEASALNAREYRHVIEVVVQEVDGQIPVIAGAGSNNPVTAIEYSKLATESGASALLHVAGYYNRPSQDGLFEHFRMVDEAAELPMLVYNVPPRTIVDIQPETMARLAQLNNVVGVKDATCDLSRPITERNLIGSGFVWLSGEDPSAVAYNAHGGVGCISVTANVAPKLCAQMQNACRSGDYDSALNIQRQLMPLHKALFNEPSPAGAKYACSLLGLNLPSSRPPIVDLHAETKLCIEDCMRQLDLI